MYPKICHAFNIQNNHSNNVIWLRIMQHLLLYVMLSQYITLQNKLLWMRIWIWNHEFSTGYGNWISCWYTYLRFAYSGHLLHKTWLNYISNVNNVGFNFQWKSFKWIISFCFEVWPEHLMYQNKSRFAIQFPSYKSIFLLTKNHLSFS